MAFIFQASGYGGACAASIPVRNCSDCVTPEPGRVDGIILTKELVFNHLDLLEWADLIKKDKAFPVGKLRGTYTDEPVTGEGFGRSSITLLNRTHTVVVEEMFDCQNLDFWQSLNNQDGVYYIYFKTALGMRLSAERVNIYTTANIEGIDTQNRYISTITWSNRNMSRCFENYPEALFTCTSLKSLLDSVCESCHETVVVGSCPDPCEPFPSFRV